MLPLLSFLSLQVISHSTFQLLAWKQVAPGPTRFYMQVIENVVTCSSNMKFVMNGGIILGTYDGATVEIHEEVGDSNIFLFGAQCDEVPGLRLAERYLRALFSAFGYCKH